MGPSRRLLGLAAAACALVGLGAGQAAASETHLLREDLGSANKPGFSEPNGLAVEQGSGDLLVIEAGAGAISRWHADGTPAPFAALGTNVIDAKRGPGGKECSEEPASCDLNPEHPGFVFGPKPGEQQVAVDSSCALHEPPLAGAECEAFDPANGDIYVTQGEQAAGNLIDVFASSGEYLGQISGYEEGGEVKPFTTGASFPFTPCGAAVGPSGELFVAGGYDRKVFSYAPAANPPVDGDGAVLASGLITPCNLAAGAGPSAGFLFANRFFGFEGDSVLRLDAATGASEGVVDPGEDRLVAVDPGDGHLYAAATIESQESKEIRELEAAGALPAAAVSSFPFGAARGIAVGGPSGEVYVSPTRGSGAAPVKVYGPRVRIPEVESGAYAITGDTGAEVQGSVDPDGEALTECSFEYLTRAEYEANPPGDKFAGAAQAPCEDPDAAGVGAGSEPVAVHAPLEGLAKEEEYEYRLCAANENAALYPEDERSRPCGGPRELHTPGKPKVKEEWATGVSAGGATLHATINPESSETEYRFEWGPTEGYGAATPWEKVAVGVDAEDHVVSATIGGLEPGTTYHWRAAAENGIGSAEGADRQLHTFRAPGPFPPCPNDALRIGPAAQLPDCRAYELVSPTEKGGGEVAVPGSNASGGSGQRNQAAASGEALTYSSWTAFGADPESAPAASQYLSRRGGGGWATDPISPPVEAAFTAQPFAGFSAELAHAVATVREPALAGAPPGFPNIYLRDNASGALTALVGEPPAVSLPSSGANYCLSFGGASEDFSRIFFAAKGKLIAGGDEEAANGFNLYEWAASRPPSEALRPVSVLPDRAPAAPDLGTGFGASPAANCEVSGALLRGAISAEGSRAYWTAAGGGAETLYLRANPAAPESERAHGVAAGSGDTVGPAQGTGNLVKSLMTARHVKLGAGGPPVAGQPISDAEGFLPAGATVTAVTVEAEEEGEKEYRLTLSAAASETVVGDGLSLAGLPSVANLSTERGAFEAGQEISGPALAAGTTIESCAPSCGAGATSLALSQAATQTVTASPLGAASECTEAATKACTITLAQGPAGSLGYLGASEDGSRALYRLDPDGSGPEAPVLYRFGATPDAAKLATATTAIAGGLEGVLGAAADLSTVYFASTEAIEGAEPNGEGEGPSPGAVNLYAWREGQGARFIAPLEAADSSDWSEDPTKQTASATPDGAHLAFLSVASLSGYDNTEAAAAGCGNPSFAGERCPEAFLYDYATKGLACASCNPSGERPAGQASLPTWSTPYRQPRYLSADGARLLFESGDALSLRDRNGLRDVYELERPGSGSCSESAAAFSAQNGGCLYLLSSGQSADQSFLVDASADGGDAFISTREPLYPADEDQNFDVYDARAGGGFAYLGPEPPCEGAEGCHEGATAAGPAPLAGSAAFTGPGNLRARRRCAAPARRAAKLSRRAGKLSRHAKRAVRHERRKKARRMRGKAKRLAKRAHRLSKRARRCRRAKRGGAR